MESKKCSKCGGELQKKRDKWICPYCNSSFDQESSKKDKDGLFDPDLFYVDVDANELMEKSNTVECIKSYRYCIDEMRTIEAIEKYLKNITQKDSATAMDGVRSERINDLKGRIDPELESGERIIILVDTSFIGKGKEYYVVTDRACRFFKKKEVISLKYDDIVSIKIDDSLNLPSFLLNENYLTTLSSVGNSYQTLGVIIALISLLAFENDSDRARIRIKK